ncbi:MAG: gamma subclass chorismate mutase AroQ [Gemmataceae bacterium]|nr:gamma subclass chorismate mutase AroQ [Gemmataceae bacterium]
MTAPSFAVVALGLILTAGCSRPSAPPPPAGAEIRAAVDELLGLMRQRLQLMPDVARAKWNAKRPISDPERERALLDNLAQQAKAKGVDAAFAQAFFASQIEGAKQIQRDLFTRWEAEKRGPFADVPDLKTDLRPQIDRLSADLLTALERAHPFLRTEEGERLVRERAAVILAGEGITDEVRQVTLAPLPPGR